jgi:hypothetical protein
VRSEILDARPVLPVIQRQVIDVEADEEQSPAVAKRKAPYRSLENGIAVREMARDERSIQPLQRGGRKQLLREIERRIGGVAVVDGARQGEYGRASVGGLRPGELRAHARRVRAQLEIRGRHEQLLRASSPVERRLERRQCDGLGKLIGPVVNRGMRVDDHVPRRFGADERAAQAAKTGCPADGREAHVAKFRAGVETPRIARGGAREAQAHVRPFARGSEIAQPLAHVLLRHESDQGEQGLRPQIIRLGMQLQHARLALAPARVELAVGIPASRGDGT